MRCYFNSLVSVNSMHGMLLTSFKLIMYFRFLKKGTYRNSCPVNAMYLVITNGQYDVYNT